MDSVTLKMKQTLAFVIAVAETVEVLVDVD